MKGMNTRASLRRGLAVLVAVLLLATAVSVALGAEISLLDGKLRTGDTVSVPSGETFDGNLYLFAGTATVDGTVDGDLTAFAGQVTVNGDVTGDLLVAGGTVTVNGDVTGDVRTAGGQVSLNGAIGEDLLVSGGQVTLAGGGAVAGDAIASGGTLSIAGSIEGSLEGSAGTYSRTGDIGGSETVRVSTDDNGDDDDAPAIAGGDRLADGLRHFVVLLILGGLLLLIMPRVIRGPTETLRTRPLLSLGGGFLAWIGFVVLVIATVLVAILLAIVFGLVQLGALAAIEIVAAILALFGASFLFWLAVAFLADLVVGFTLARLVAPEAPGANPWRDLGLLAGGVAVVVIVTSLPIIGGIAKLLVVLFGLGALVVAAWNRWRSPARPAAAEPATV
jgi:hypothetical protein